MPIYTAIKTDQQSRGRFAWRLPVADLPGTIPRHVREEIEGMIPGAILKEAETEAHQKALLRLGADPGARRVLQLCAASPGLRVEFSTVADEVVVSLSAMGDSYVDAVRPLETPLPFIESATGEELAEEPQQVKPLRRLRVRAKK